MNTFFRKIANKFASIAGKPWTFVLALLLILIWGFSGRRFSYSDTWQLMINTTTTVVTFLMVFLIQNTQNRDAKVVQIKLDELLKAIKQARAGLIDLEEFSDEEIDKLYKEFRGIAEREKNKKRIKVK